MIVLVDDDATFRSLLAANLEDAGFRVQDFPGAAPALAWVAEGHRAEAWVLDWRMPEIDGPARVGGFSGNPLMLMKPLMACDSMS